MVLHSVILSITLFFAGQLAALSQKELAQTIDRLCHSVDPQMHIGIEIVSLHDRQALYSKHAHKRFIPASTMKLFTATAMLATFGFEYQYTTRLVSTGIKKKQAIVGDLFLVASGDPSLRSEDLVTLFTTLKQQGIKKIKGDIIIDTTIFDEEHRGPGWMWDDGLACWNAPISALVIDHNCATNSAGSLAAVADQQTFMLQKVEEALKKAHIAVTGCVRVAKAPAMTHEIAVHTSAALQELVAVMLKESDNLYADCFLKTLGTVQGNADDKQGSWRSGAAVLQQFTGFEVFDGCGRSRYALVSPRDLVSLLLNHSAQPSFRTFLHTLSRSGVDGSLKNRLHQHPVWAKTGTMRGISCLAGYTVTADKEPVAFAIMINNFIGDASRYKKLEDAICVLIGKFRRSE